MLASRADVAVVIVNYRTPGLTERCLAALRPERALLPKLRILIVDGGSGDESAAQLAKFIAKPEYRPWVSFLPLPLNGGFGWANNQAILTLARQAEPPEFIHLLNPDTEVVAGAVAGLVQELLDNPHCGAAGSQLFDEAGQCSGSAFRFPTPGRELTGSARSEILGRVLGVKPLVIRSRKSVEVDWVTGASVMFRSQTLRESGLFDDGFFLYFEEVELMHRLRQHGWSVRHVPASRVIHLEGASTGVGAAGAEKPLPAYWYQSRERYFGLTGGRRAIWAANLGSLVGLGIGAAKTVIGRSGGGQAAQARDWLRLAGGARRNDFHPAAPAWGDAPGQSPAWMKTP